jgi:D-3-phosphoglycerate dehydrogenase
MLNLLRNIPFIDRKLRLGEWNRYTGERLANQVIGIIGTGRIGSKVLKHLQGFNPKKILVNDIKPNEILYKSNKAELVEKEVIFKESDIITLHVPLTPVTRNLVTVKELGMMKESVYLINTSRGGIINEEELYQALEAKKIRGAALDVFSMEPYVGPLTKLDNCIFSSHIGSMTKDCRVRMEIEAVEEAIRFVNGESLQHVIPEEEYTNCSF